jgi:hypothetical protein
MSAAPIALFVYARPEHARLTLEALRRCPQTPDHDLIVFSDGARTPDKQSAVQEVRNYLATVQGFRSVVVHNRPHNFGLAKSIIEGVTQVLQEHDRIIVLEDDMVTSHHFLSYMDAALDRFADDDRVISIHGYVYPVHGSALPEAFFLRGADCWGWATWKRGWDLFNADGKMLLDQLRQRDLLNDFDFNGSYPYSAMLTAQTRGHNNSWAIRWYASAFIADKLTLYPGRSLVHNIGNDDSGTHCADTQLFDTLVSQTSIRIEDLPVAPSLAARQAFEAFFRSTRPSIFKRVQQAVSTVMQRLLQTSRQRT